MNDGFPLIEPLIRLENYLCMLDVTRIPKGTTRIVVKGIPLNINRTITEEVQPACEMLKEVRGQVKSSPFRRPIEP